MECTIRNALFKYAACGFDEFDGFNGFIGFVLYDCCMWNAPLGMPSLSMLRVDSMDLMDLFSMTAACGMHHQECPLQAAALLKHAALFKHAACKLRPL